MMNTHKHAINHWYKHNLFAFIFFVFICFAIPPCRVTYASANSGESADAVNFTDPVGSVDSAQQATSSALSSQKTLPSEFSFQQMRTEFSSPIHSPARTYLLAGTGATLFFLAFKKELEDPFHEQTVRDKPLGDFSEVGDLGGQFITNAFYAAGFGIHYSRTKDARSLNRAAIMIKASTYAVLTSTALKLITRERRPDSNEKNSFPSGHTTAASAFAAVVVGQHGWAPYGILATGLAVLTGYSRINDNRHYLHDVLAGATIGTAFGVGVSSLYGSYAKFGNRLKSRTIAKHGDPSEANTGSSMKKNIYFAPFIGASCAGVVGSIEF